MGGGEALAAMRRLAPGLRVVLLSGYGRGNVLGLFGDASPDDFLEKPFHHEDLLSVVRSTLLKQA